MRSTLMCTFIKKPIHWESVQAPSTITTFPRTSVSWWRAVGKQGGGKGREKIHEQCRTDKTGEDKRRDSQEVQHISWLLLGRQQPCAHTHTHTFLWWWLWLPLHTHFLPVVAHGAYETIK